MRVIVAGHQACSTDEFIELALGTPVELWLGVEGESNQERTARQEAARDILADDPGLFDRVSHLAAELLDTIPVPRPRSFHDRRRTASGAEAAA